MTRQEAIALKVKPAIYQGKPCRNCGNVNRYVACCACTRCKIARQSKFEKTDITSYRAYRNWYNKRPHVKARIARYRAAHRELIRATNRRSYEKVRAERGLPFRQAAGEARAVWLNTFQLLYPSGG